MKSISVADDYRHRSITREEGEPLRARIREALEGGDDVELDFAGEIVASSSFLEESLAKLLTEGISREEFTARVHLKNLHPKDRVLLERLLSLRS